jgi:hypothetical protein
VRRLGIFLAITAIVLAGCGIGGLFGPSGGPYPGACADLGFAPRQCAAIVARARSDVGIYPLGDPTIDILPPTDDGNVRIGGGMISRVRFHLADGRERTVEVWCVGVGGGGDDACNSDPTITIGAAHVNSDIPCTGGGDPPTGCATFPPTPRPEVQAKATPLRIPAVDIPLDHLGSYRIELGEAGLPDGAFSDSSASLADERPTNFWIRDASLVIEPVDPGRPPIGSIFREPFDGIEQVRVSLEFNVTELSPGAVLQVRDVVVR